MESKIEWHYLPELPKEESEVLVSVINYVGIRLFCNGKFHTISDEEYQGYSNVYAWAYLPEPAEVK